MAGAQIAGAHSAPQLRAVRIGAAATLEVETREGPREYRTRIEDVEGELVHVAMPTEQGTRVVLPLGEEVLVRVSTTAAASVDVRGQVIARKMSPYPVLVLRALEVEANQQRSFHRVRVWIEPEEVWVWVGEGEPPSGAKPDGQNADWHRMQGTVSDLSGGGLGLRMAAPLPERCTMWLRFSLPLTCEVLAVRGRAVSARTTESAARAGAAPYQVGVRFEELSRVDQERLVRALTRVQLEERRKARGG